ncbi:MAG TPA: hypothetical protein VFZ65_22440 [Planctomycetota bacterium]|nr:hypothetical protein [Planctomycetota bacterium]
MKLLPLVFLSTSLAAQNPAGASPNAAGEAADQKASVASALTDLARSLDDPELVLFDQPEADGPTWGRASNYKVSFDLDGWRFLAKPLPGAPALAPLRVHTELGDRQAPQLVVPVAVGHGAREFLAPGVGHPDLGRRHAVVHDRDDPAEERYVRPPAFLGGRRRARGDDKDERARGVHGSDPVTAARGQRSPGSGE